MDDIKVILCDICKKNPYITTIEYKSEWIGVCKKCKHKIEKEKKNCYINTGD